MHVKLLTRSLLFYVKTNKFCDIDTVKLRMIVIVLKIFFLIETYRKKNHPKIIKSHPTIFIRVANSLIILVSVNQSEPSISHAQ